MKKIILKKFPFKFINFIRMVRGYCLFSVYRYLPSFLVKYLNPYFSLKFGRVNVCDLHDLGQLNQVSVRWGVAFSEYEKNISQNPIRLLWADGPCPGNFGDWLSPYIFSKISKKPIINVPDFSNCNKRHILGIGSIVIKANSLSLVIGSGIAKSDENLCNSSHYHLVRGPYTAKAIIRAGGQVCEKFGDPGYVISLVAPRTVSANNQVLFIRHLTHQNLHLVLPEYFREISINAASIFDIENILNEICCSNLVVTSAMHCYIACMSYGVPCALIDFDGAGGTVYGDGIKYLDAMEGIGNSGVPPVRVGSDLRHLDFMSMADTRYISLSRQNQLYDDIKLGLNLFD